MFSSHKFNFLTPAVDGNIKEKKFQSCSESFTTRKKDDS